MRESYFSYNRLKTSSPFLGREYGNCTHGAVVLTPVVLHAEIYISNDGNLFPLLLSILNDVGGANTRTDTITPISTDTLLLIKNKLNLTHRTSP